jgi:SNF2-related domain/Helicase conserved C-terminal domain/SWIM zinc finger
MDNPKKILSSDIRYECGDASYERGRSYYEKNQVLDFSVKGEGALYVQLNAGVKGSALTPYKQNIRIVWRPDYSSVKIDGYCSCPVGYNCKHVAAVCLNYQNSSAPSSAKEINCLDWLDGFKEEVVIQHDKAEEFIAYVLKPVGVLQDLTVDFYITKAKKTGGYAKGRKTTLSNLRYSYAYTSYIHTVDGEIAKLLAILTSSSGQPLISGAGGYLTVTKMLSSGRLFWLDIEKGPLIPGKSRNLHYVWQQLDNGDYKLDVQMESDTVFLCTDPPQFIDPSASVLGAIDNNKLTGGQLKKLLNAPVIPAEQAEEFSYKLAIQYPDLHLPAPKELALIEVNDELPGPHLLLIGELQGREYGHFMSLKFNYGNAAIPAFPEEVFSVFKSDQGLLRVKRNPEQESDAVNRLAEIGFLPADNFGSQPTGLFSPNVSGGMENAALWGYFLEFVRPELEQAGWHIEVDPSFLLTFQTADNWRAEINEGRNDWFEMNFDIEVDGRTMPLLPLIMPVLENYEPDDLPEILNIHLENHHYLKLPSEKIRPFLAVLYELFSISTVDKTGTLKFSRFQAATLADLEAHSYGLFSLRGGSELRELGKKLKNFTGIAEVSLPENLHAELRHYQRQGLNWLQFLREYRFAGILADDMGLGKTIQTLAHLLIEKQSGRMDRPCLIVAPTSLMSNWRRETEKFTPELTVLTLQGNERKQLFNKIKDYDLVLTTYPLLSRDEDTLLQQDYYYLILDEAQTVKNPLAKAAQLVRRVNSQHRLCLTGTPMENHLGELWAQFDFLMPGFLGDSTAFKRLYRTPIEIQGNNLQKVNLSRRLAPFMLRRTKQEVATELPPKTEIIRSVPLYPKQAALYESIRLTMEKKVRNAIAQKGLSRSHITILDALLKLRQTCCDPRTLTLAEAQKIKDSAKLDLLMDLLPEQLEEGRRILVFSQFTRMIALIEEKLKIRKILYSKLTGQTRSREEAIELFKSGAVNVFLISLKAGGVGLNLTEADTIIIYDPWWNPAVEDQAADRAYRIGQDKPVFVYKLITENTVEEKILAMQEKKRSLASSIYKSGGKNESLQLTADDLTALFEPL